MRVPEIEKKRKKKSKLESRVVILRVQTKKYGEYLHVGNFNCSSRHSPPDEHDTWMWPVPTYEHIGEPRRAQPVRVGGFGHNTIVDAVAATAVAVTCLLVPIYGVHKRGQRYLSSKLSPGGLAHALCRRALKRGHQWSHGTPFSPQSGEGWPSFRAHHQAPRALVKAVRVKWSV